MLAKDFHKLMKNISSFSGNQAKVLDYKDDLECLKVEIIPNSGFYRGGKFDFEITPSTNYPKEAPSVKCATAIYHPNIDSDNGDICLNLFSEWTESNNLEDCVQGLLFLLYNPNLEDPLSPWFDPEEDNDEEVFAERVKTSLEGGEIEGVIFERNQVEEITKENGAAINHSHKEQTSTEDLKEPVGIQKDCEANSTNDKTSSTGSEPDANVDDDESSMGTKIKFEELTNLNDVKLHKPVEETVVTLEIDLEITVRGENTEIS